jgi:hypothetical protein
MENLAIVIIVAAAVIYLVRRYYKGSNTGCSCSCNTKTNLPMAPKETSRAVSCKNTCPEKDEPSQH